MKRITVLLAEAPLPERGCVPRRAESAAAAPQRATRWEHCDHRSFRRCCGWSRATKHRPGRGCFLRWAGSAAATPQRATRRETSQGRIFALPPERRLQAAATWQIMLLPRERGVPITMQPRSVGARLCPAPSGISRSNSATSDALGNIAAASHFDVAAAGRGRHSRAPRKASRYFPPSRLRSCSTHVHEEML